MSAVVLLSPPNDSICDANALDRAEHLGGRAVVLLERDQRVGRRLDVGQRLGLIRISQNVE